MQLIFPCILYVCCLTWFTIKTWLSGDRVTRLSWRSWSSSETSWVTWSWPCRQLMWGTTESSHWATGSRTSSGTDGSHDSYFRVNSEYISENAFPVTWWRSGTKLACLKFCDILRILWLHVTKWSIKSWSCWSNINIRTIACFTIVYLKVTDGPKSG